MMKYRINDYVYVEIIGTSIRICDEADETEVWLPCTQIDDVIEALKQARSHYRAKEMAEAEREALARWGKAPIPGGDVKW